MQILYKSQLLKEMTDRMLLSSAMVMSCHVMSCHAK